MSTYAGQEPWFRGGSEAFASSARLTNRRMFQTTRWLEQWNSDSLITQNASINEDGRTSGVRYSESVTEPLTMVCGAVPQGHWLNNRLLQCSYQAACQRSAMKSYFELLYILKLKFSRPRPDEKMKRWKRSRSVSIITRTPKISGSFGLPLTRRATTTGCMSGPCCTSKFLPDNLFFRGMFLQLHLQFQFSFFL